MPLSDATSPASDKRQFQTLTTPAPSPLNIREPSSENASALTVVGCAPAIVRSGRFESTVLHTRIAPSKAPVMTTCGEVATG